MVAADIVQLAKSARNNSGWHFLNIDPDAPRAAVIG
jgi:hypothetical protein